MTREVQDESDDAAVDDADARLVPGHTERKVLGDGVVHADATDRANPLEQRKASGVIRDILLLMVTVEDIVVGPHLRATKQIYRYYHHTSDALPADP